MSWKSFARDYLYFSRKDRIAVFCLVALMAIVYALPMLLLPGSTHGVLPVTDTTLQAVLKSWQVPAGKPGPKDEEVSLHPYASAAPRAAGALFLFDPNTLSAEGWQSLGLSGRVTKTIENYRSKGGRFHKPEDVKKIWGLPQGFYERVANYIQITQAGYEKTTVAYKPTPFAKREGKNIAIADLNTADTTALIALPGIGSKLAARISAFRDKLGGFYTVSQVAETYGLADSTFQKIKPFLQVDAAGLRKLNINTATKDELKVHPYIGWNLSNAIVAYRAQHGPFTTLDELKHIVLVDETTFEKIRHYLSL